MIQSLQYLLSLHFSVRVVMETLNQRLANEFIGGGYCKFEGEI